MPRKMYYQTYSPYVVFANFEQSCDLKCVDSGFICFLRYCHELK